MKCFKIIFFKFLSINNLQTNGFVVFLIEMMLAVNQNDQLFISVKDSEFTKTKLFFAKFSVKAKN